MQRQETFPVLPLSYLHMTQEGGHDLDIPESLVASSRSAVVLAWFVETFGQSNLEYTAFYNGTKDMAR